jgi:hypothetical protein
MLVVEDDPPPLLHAAVESSASGMQVQSQTKRVRMAAILT